MIILADTDRALLFLMIAACLGGCFVWAFWELEQLRERHRRRSAAKAQSSAGRSSR
jgi:hypothetical protein